MGGCVSPPLPNDDDLLIPQFDGNCTLSFSESLIMPCSTVSSPENVKLSPSLSQFGSEIPVVINAHIRTASTAPPPWYELYTVYTDRSEYRPIRKTIYRDNRLAKCVSLPTVSVANLRSLWPKINNVKNDILEREIGVALWSEVWEKKGKKKHINQVESMFQLEGLKYISTPRPSYKRGGGCAIVAYLPKFSLEKIDVTIPKSVEVVYGLLRPKNISTTTTIREIIAVAFYSPPKSRKKTALIDHILTTCHMLLTRYPNAGLMIGGDRNEMSISPLLVSFPKLHQIVTKNTCNGKVLDVLLTNLSNFYNVPLVVPPVPADDPNKGSPSDHSPVLAVPLTNGTANITNEYKTKTFRPLPESGIAKFGDWLSTEDWRCMQTDMAPTQQVGAGNPEGKP